MRIAYLTGQYPRATDTFIQREVQALRDRGLDVQTFAVRPPGIEQLVGTEQHQEFANTTYILPPKLWDLVRFNLSLLVTAPRRYVRAIKLAVSTAQPGLKGGLYQAFYFAEAGWLAQTLKARRIDHLHNHLADSSCTVALLASSLSHIPFSFTIHGPSIFFEPRRWRIDAKIQAARFVSCISYFCRSQCMLFSPAEAWPKLRIIHCGIVPEKFAPKTHTGTGHHLLYTGRLANAKGLPILIQSLPLLLAQDPQVHLTIIGDGSDRSALEAQVNALNLGSNVAFVGYKSQDEVRDYLQQADIFVLPSFAEGVPVSLMEAMAAGLPVVTTAIAGIGELVEDGHSGYLVKPGDPVGLAAKIWTLMADPAQRQRLGDNGRQQVTAEFNLHREADKLSQIFQERSSE
ncbi:glycosyltransferase family 4 protein [Prochlorothrix hollandica]|uniref:glycosyltransferase family 4 protein n=1 Tax=Prochlorothrix hollandica TaxID=1223 RepID=UPI003DA77820